jgi:membrane fusion protein (multidrug efflux system)
MTRRLVPALLALSILAVAGYAAWLYVDSRHRVSTEDAYVEGALTMISARVGGPVARVLVRDNEEVREGQVVAEIDPRDYEIRVEQARAAVARAAAEARAARTEVPLTRQSTQSRVQQAEAGLQAARLAVEVGRAQVAETRVRVEGRRAAVAAARAEAAMAEAALDKARRELTRMSRLVEQGLVSVQDHETAEVAHRSAAAALDAANRRLAQAEREAEQADAEVRTRELAVEQARERAAEAAGLLAQAESERGEVPVKEAGVGRAVASLQQAEADLAAAELQLAKTRLRAPTDGVVSKKSVEPGQLVQPGQPLMALVPLHGVWVLANFKETQLARVRPGQRATFRVDTFPDRVFVGRVESISAGTGSRFSLLPPENASGNWVKVVQRVPVKIAIEGYRANPHILRAGMSATVTVDVR